MTFSGIAGVQRHSARPVFTSRAVTVLGAWLAVWIGFTLLGIFSAIQMRVNLAAAPLFVCLGAYGLMVIARRTRVGLLVSGVATIAIAINGVRVWLMCLGR